MPFVSVIIPNYNHAPYLKQRIDSVVNQTYTDIEVIILDDCSRDDSRQIIELYRNHPKVSQVVFNEVNSGSPFKQWSKGIEIAKGEYIWIAESDDYCEPNFLEEAFAVILKQKNISLIYCQSFDVNSEGDILKSRIQWTDGFENNLWADNFCVNGQDLLPFIVQKNVIPNVSACVINKNEIQEILKQNSDVFSFKMCGDWYVWMLLLQQPNSKIAFIKKPLNYYRLTSQATRNHRSERQKQQRILEEAHILSRANSAQRDAVNDRWKDLKFKWFKVSEKVFNSDFYAISSYLHITKLSLLVQFIGYKLKLVKH